MSQEKNGQEQITETRSRSRSRSRSRPIVDHNENIRDQKQWKQSEHLQQQGGGGGDGKKQKHIRYYNYYLAVGVAFVAALTATILSSRASSVATPAASATTKQRFAVLSEAARDTFGSLRLQRLFATMTTTAATTTPAAAADRETSATTPFATMRRKKEEPTQYKLINKTQLSPDSYWLRYEIPKPQPVKPGEEGGSGGSGSSSSNSNEDDILGYDPSIPTCIKVDYPHGTCPKTLQSPHTLSKSYSPVSHPSLKGYFDLIVKSYEDDEDGGRPGGGVGKYICDMDVGQSITASLKSERIMHGSPHVLGRGWKHIGLVAGGTGIAPLLQIARIVLKDCGDGPERGDDAALDQDDERIVGDDGDDVQVHLLFINRNEHDVLGRSEIDKMAEKYKGRFHVSYALTNYGNCDNSSSSKYFVGRGDVETAMATLPPPQPGKTMIFVCGKDGFVEHWAGPVGRAPPPPGKKKGPKIQGPLLGVLADAGYTADQVFKY